MGFYDARCMVTGVSLKGSETALVLLQQQEESYHPIALAITGQYDREGSIDGIDEDDNTALILQYFLNQLAAKAFVVDAESLRSDEAYPIETIEQLLRGFERNINDGPGYAALNGQPVVFALIASTVWNAIARGGTVQSADDGAAFQELFKAAPVAAGIYDGHLEDVSQQLHAFAAVSALLTARSIKWKPAADGYQHYSDDMREFLKSARAKFRDSPAVLEGLNAYKSEVSDLLED
jgi:hypothetical protein